MFFWFVLLFVLSWLPWIIAFIAEIKPAEATEQDKKILRGLAVIDATLTAASAVFLVMAIGWLALVTFGLMIGVAFIMEAFDLQPYEAIKNH